MIRIRKEIEEHLELTLKLNRQLVAYSLHFLHVRE